MDTIGKVLAMLKTRFDDNRDIELYTLGGDSYRAKCSFNPPATDAMIEELSEKLTVRLPEDYRKMLHFHNGMKLFYTEEYGGAIEFFSVDDIPKNYDYLQNIYEGEPDEFGRCIPIGHYPDTGWIVLDMKRYEDNTRNYIRVFGIPHIGVPGSFEDFFDRLVVAQGAAYWEWIY